jgi:hypothetical protein
MIDDVDHLDLGGTQERDFACDANVAFVIYGLTYYAMGCRMCTALCRRGSTISTALDNPKRWSMMFEVMLIQAACQFCRWASSVREQQQKDIKNHST